LSKGITIQLHDFNRVSTYKDECATCGQTALVCCAVQLCAYKQMSKELKKEVVSLRTELAQLRDAMEDEYEEVPLPEDTTTN
jgi:hypothetical protein